jgi:hypothetical protein
MAALEPVGSGRRGVSSGFDMIAITETIPRIQQERTGVMSNSSRFFMVVLLWVSY